MDEGGAGHGKASIRSSRSAGRQRLCPEWRSDCTGAESDKRADECEAGRGLSVGGQTADLSNQSLCRPLGTPSSRPLTTFCPSTRPRLATFRYARTTVQRATIRLQRRRSMSPLSPASCVHQRCGRWESRGWSLVQVTSDSVATEASCQSTWSECDSQVEEASLKFILTPSLVFHQRTAHKRTGV